MNIVILSDSPMIPTGYSNQAKQLVQRFLKEGHNVTWLANAYTGQSLDYIKLEDGTEFKCKIVGHGFNDPYFQSTLSQYLKELKADRFIILLDTFMLFPWLLDKDLSPAKTFFWYPSDGGAGMPKGCERILQKVDVPVAMAKFGQKQVKDYHKIETAYIPHGIDIKRFYRLPDAQRNELRTRWGFQDKFVIGVVARNQPRKFLDRTLKIMYLLKERVPNAILFLHLDPNDAAQSFNLPSIIQKYGLENRIVFSGMQAHKGFGWDQMNEVYNLMDVFLLSTSGEGFGIPIIEAMACEVPVLATNYTTTEELVLNNKAGLGINLVGTGDVSFFDKDANNYDWLAIDGTIFGSWEVERGLCSIKDGADKLLFMSTQPQALRDMGKNGRKAVVEEYDFDKVSDKWLELIK